ncbi:MAG: MarR family transcriptional regulator [Bacteroidota bacterium]
MKDQDLNKVFLFKLDQTAKQFKKYKNHIFKQNGIDITSDQWILLKNIKEKEGINQTELAKRSKKEAAAVTRTLDILERKEWIKRERDPESRREYNLYTTRKGDKIVEKILPIALAIRKKAKRSITKEDLGVFNKVLDAIYQNLT